MSLKLESSRNVSVQAFALMIVLSVLPLLDGGFDHDVMYWALFVLLLAALIITFKAKAGVYVDIYHPLFWYVLFLLWTGFSVAWSLNPHRTLVELLQLCIYGLVFVLAMKLREEDLYRVGRIAIFAGLGVAFFGIAEYLFVSTGRIESTFPNSNPLGTYLLLIFLLFWAYSLRAKKTSFYFLAVIILAALFLSGSRGAFISFAFALPFLFLGFQTRKEIYKAASKTLACILLAVLLTQGIMAAGPRVQDAVGEEGEKFVQHVTRPESFVARSGAGRLEFWKVGARLGASEPVLGHGLGTFYTAYFEEYVDGRWFSRFTHNHYIQVFAENGIIGLLLFSGFILAVLRVGLYKFKQGLTSDYFAGLISACIGFLIHIGGDFSFNFPGATVIFFAGAGVLARNLRSIDSLEIRSPVSKLRLKLAEKYLGYRMIAVFLAFVLAITAWQYSAKVFYARGVERELEGRFQDAVKTYDRANSIYPINPDAYSYAAESYLNLYRFSEEEEHLQKALDRQNQAVNLNPVDSVNHHTLGLIYKDLDDLEQAEEHLRSAVTYAGFRIGMYLELAILYLEKEEFLKAERVLIKGLEVKEDALASSRDDETLEKRKSEIEAMKSLLEQLENRKQD